MLSDVRGNEVGRCKLPQDQDRYFHIQFCSMICMIFKLNIMCCPAGDKLS